MNILLKKVSSKGVLKSHTNLQNKINTYELAEALDTIKSYEEDKKLGRFKDIKHLVLQIIF